MQKVLLLLVFMVVVMSAESSDSFLVKKFDKESLDSKIITKQDSILLSLIINKKYYSFNTKSGLSINIKELFSRDGYSLMLDDLNHRYKSDDLIVDKNFLVTTKLLESGNKIRVDNIYSYLSKYGKQILTSKSDYLYISLNKEVKEIVEVKKVVVTIKTAKEYLSALDFPKALEAYSKKKNLKLLDYNPFNAHTDIIDNKKKTKSKKTIVDFLKTIIKIQNILKENEYSTMDNYLIASAYYNLSSYGNLDMLKNDKQLLKLSKIHYEKALKSVKKNWFKKKLKLLIKRVNKKLAL